MWTSIDHALSHGRRGLTGGSSLPRVLAKYRGIQHHPQKPPLSVKRILGWADAH